MARTRPGAGGGCSISSSTACALGHRVEPPAVSDPHAHGEVSCCLHQVLRSCPRTKAQALPFGLFDIDKWNLGRPSSGDPIERLGPAGPISNSLSHNRGALQVPTSPNRSQSEQPNRSASDVVIVRV